MKAIAHFVPHVGKVASGYGYAVPRLCRELADAHYNVQLISIKKRVMNYGTSSEIIYDDLCISNIGNRIYEIAKVVDVLHSHSLWRSTNILPAWASKRLHKPHVISPRGTLNPAAMRHSRIRKKVFSVLVQERTLRQASMLHATSVGEYSDIRKAGLEQPVAIIPNGVDVPELFHNKMGRDNRRLLYVGRIHPIKGLELVLDCWTQLTGSYPDWVFRIVGPLDSNYAVKLKERYLLNRVPRVEFVGERSGQALIKEYQDADALVLPSLSENFGMVVAESLSNATPVLTTKGTPWEGLCKNKCGWWVDRDGEDLCVALQQILSAERDVLRRMGLQGRQWMIEEFSWRQVAKNMLSAYLWLLEKGERPTFVHD